MKISINVFVFCICSLLAFGCGLDEDLTEIRQMMGKLSEENTAILRREVESIRCQYREENDILRSKVESIREENAILRSEVETIRRQCREENAIVRSEVRSEVEAINLRLEGVQEGNNIL